ncbi:MAG: hypothetical protein IT445_17330 [Phycisphaeraceae bacterium]|nr:hypothetical protein [Phycisphaeraceae bacterium]
MKFTMVSIIATLTVAAMAPSLYGAIDPTSGLTQANSSSFTFKYEMDLNPRLPAEIDLDGNTLADFLASTGPTVFNTGVAGTTDGYTAALNYVRPGTNEILTGQAGSSTWDTTVFTSGGGYTLEVRVKVISTETDGLAKGLNIDANINNGAGYAWLNIVDGSQGWGASKTDLGTNDNTDGFHTFRIAYIQNNTVNEWWVWRDGVLLNPGNTALPVGLAGSAKRVFIGSPGNDWGGVGELDYVRFTNEALAPIPEPASAVIIALGIGAMCMRSRVRQRFHD